MRVVVTTVGCRLNQFESDALERLFAEAGHQIVTGPEAADVHVVNSCTVTHAADADTRQLIRRAARTQPGVSIVVTGCYATRAAAELGAMDEVALVVGNRDKHRLVELVACLVKADNSKVLPGSAQPPEALQHQLQPALNPRRRSRAYLKIQDGCNYRCAFCIVPQVRGPSRSLSPAIALKQLDELVAAGVPEIVLTGVHLGTYGRDLNPQTTVSELLAAMVPRVGASRLRLSSIDPHEVSEDLLAVLAEHAGRISRHLHLPVQSCDPAVLRAMRRPHTVAAFSSLTKRLVAEIPGIAVGSDVIVGFPGETPEQFATTERVLAELPLAYLHVFSYSQRSGTPASELPGQLPHAVKAVRSRALRQLSSAKQRAFAEALEGCELDAVVLHQRDRKSGNLVALTDNYVRVIIEGPTQVQGTLQRIRMGPLTLGGNGPHGVIGALRSSQTL